MPITTTPTSLRKSRQLCTGFGLWISNAALERAVTFSELFVIERNANNFSEITCYGDGWRGALRPRAVLSTAQITAGKPTS
jgi:hypothetical protein